MHIGRLFAVVVLNCCFAASLWAAFDPAQYPPHEPLPSRKAITGVLDNGVRYVIDRNHRHENKNRAAIFVVVDVGSVYESDGEAGYTHFIEHLGFRGSARHQPEDVQAFMASMGVAGLFHSQNAATAQERTQYVLTIPENPDRFLGKALDVLAARALEPAITAAAVEAERSVILAEELTRRVSQSSRQRYRLLLGELHPYLNHDTVGLRDTIEQATVADLNGFRAIWFRPDRTTVIVVGDINVKKATRLVRTAFGRYQNPDSDNPARHVIRDPEGYDAAVVGDEDARIRSVQLSTLTKLLGADTLAELKSITSTGLAGAILNDRIRTYADQTTDVLSTRYSRQRLAALVVSTLSISVEDGAELRAFREVLDVVAGALETGFTAEEVNVAKTLASQRLRTQLERADRISSGRIGRAWVNALSVDQAVTDTAVGVSAGLFVLEQLDLEAMNHSLRSQFDQGRRVLLVTVPEDETPVAPIEIFEETLARLDVDWGGRELEEGRELVADAPGTTVDPFHMDILKPGTIVEELIHKPLGILEWRLSNGATVLFKSTPTKSTRIQIRGIAPGGAASLESYNEESVAAGRDILLASGLRGYQGPKLANLFSLHRSWMRIDLREQRHGVRVSTVPEELDFAMRALHLMLTEAAIDPAIYTSVVSKVRTQFEATGEVPALRHRQAVLDQLWLNSIIGKAVLDPEALDVLTPDWVASMYQTLFKNVHGVTFLISGPVKARKLKPYVTKYLASLPGGKRHTLVRTSRTLAEKTETVRTQLNLKDRSEVVRIYVNANAGYDYRLMVIRQMYTTLLQNTLQQTVRVDRGLVYTIGASESSPEFPVPHGFINVQFVADPGNVEEINALVNTSLLEAVENIDGEQLEVLQRQRKRSIETYYENPGNVLLVFYRDRTAGEPPLSVKARKKIVDGITVDDLQAFAKRVATDMPVVVGEFAPVEN